MELPALVQDCFLVVARERAVPSVATGSAEESQLGVLGCAVGMTSRHRKNKAVQMAGSDV